VQDRLQTLDPATRRAYRPRAMAADHSITRLRAAIDSLPLHTREAMLDGIRKNPIIVGAYTDSRGGICPMLAAHRNGGRHTHLPFARAWDELAGSKRVRKATHRELRILEAQLQASLLAQSPEVDLKAAIDDHIAMVQRRNAQASAPRDTDTPREIVARRLNPRSAIRALRPVVPGRESRDVQRALERLERELERTL
jgi:hypothetical protein